VTGYDSDETGSKETIFLIELAFVSYGLVKPYNKNKNLHKG